MRLIVSILALALAGVGCKTVDKQQTCESAAAALAAYQAYVVAGQEPSRDQILAATAATAFLTSYCGWQPAPQLHTKSAGAILDENGVPIILPPR